MRHLELLASVQGLTPAEVYAAICDFSRYPEHSEAVRSVKITNTDDGRSLSTWEVNFREGILRWMEEDTFIPDQNILRFRQIEGDVEYFAGEWSVSQVSGECVIRFGCDFELGVPGLNEIIGPIAEQALRDNTRSIIAGLIPSARFVSADRG